MGGDTFENTTILSISDYNDICDQINDIGMIENIDFAFPFRLKNKEKHNDIDIILLNTDKFIELFSKKYKIKEIKKIPLFEERFGLYSQHILTDKFIQIDLLKSYCVESIEISRLYYSYSFANIFLKKLTSIVDRNLKFSYLGMLCTSNKFPIKMGVKFIQIDKCTRLIVDCEYIFTILDLDLNKYIGGFENEFELLDYFSQSKYFSQIKFKYNSNFKHDYNRLKPFANLVNSNLIQVENFVQN
jgi:hypothetical protein